MKKIFLDQQYYVFEWLHSNKLAECVFSMIGGNWGLKGYNHRHLLLPTQFLRPAWYQQAGREVGAGRSLSNWIIESSDYVQPIKMLILNCFQCLHNVGWSFSSCIAWRSQQWWLIKVSVSTIDIEVSRLAIVCPCLLRIMILCYSPRPKSGLCINQSNQEIGRFWSAGRIIMTCGNSV